MRRLLSCFALLAASAAAAQDNAPAGLYTPEARQLPVVSQTLQVVARSGVADLKLTQLFFNDGPDLGQADYQLHLPDQATLTSFGFWRGETLIRAELKEKSEAERAHAAAVREGRATAILKTDHGVQRFSVFPVKSGEYQRVELELRLPVPRELGRNQLALAVDRFLARGRATATVTVEVHADEPLSEVGVAGARARTVSRTERTAQLAFSTEQPVELWWTEKGQPLSVGAEAVPLAEGGQAVALRILLNDAGAWRAPYSAVHVLVDGSFSMRRRRAALIQAVDRLQDQAAAQVTIWAVGERTRKLTASGEPTAIVSAALDGASGFGATAGDFVKAMATAGCGRREVRCVALTDLQLQHVAELAPHAASFLFLTDAHERAHFEGVLPPDAALFQPDVETPARLRALADEKVLPVLEVLGVSQGGKVLEPVRAPSLRVAEGGLLRLFFETEGSSPLTLLARIGGKDAAPVAVPIASRVPASDEGRVIRYGFWERKLAHWMAAYRRSPDAELKKLIVEASLREGVPTAFTALQAASPELSLHDIKPGDPLLTVRAEKGLEEVVAWYPFGEARRLAQDEATGAFHDRFLVPRGWDEKSYAVEVFKRFADGTVRQERAWYALDDGGPQVSVVEVDASTFEVRQRDLKGDLSTVRVELADGTSRTLSPVDGRWVIATEGLPPGFTVVARDRAGNTVHVAVGAAHEPRASKAPNLAQATAPALVPPLHWTRGGGLSFEGEDAVVRLGERRYRFLHAESPLASGALTASFPLRDGLLFGTARGDLVRLTCGEIRCSASVPEGASGLLDHPVTGLAELRDGSVLVGILGEGLFELRGQALVRSRLEVGSAFVTAVVHDGRDVLVGTAYNGLWRIVGRRAIRARFPSQHVTRIAVTARGQVELVSGATRYLQQGRDRYAQQPGSPAFEVGSPAVMAAAELEGTLYVGGFDGGLYQWERGVLAPVPLPLSGLERQLNALAVHQGTLWLGTEGGLLRAVPDRDGLRLQRLHGEAVQDLAAGPHGLAVATSSGAFLLDPGEAGGLRRLGGPNGGELRRLFAVEWVGAALYAGGLDGLYRLSGETAQRVGTAAGFRGGWVTALQAHQGTLFVGTYASGLYALEGAIASPVRGLEDQWVPLRGLATVGEELWVGGLGMSAARLSAEGQLSRLHLPARDTNGFLASPSGGVLALTSDGVIELGGTQLLATYGR